MAATARSALPRGVSLVEWLRARDAGFSALRRATRAAILVPAVFAVADLVIGNPTLAIFAAFGSFSMLLFVDFSGTIRERMLAQANLVLAGLVLITIATLASRVTWLAVAATLVVAFAVLFAGVVSSVLASATTALLVSFVLPVTLPGPASSIPDRLLGWLLAGAVALVAIVVLWPAPAYDPLRRPTARACALLGRRLRAEVDCARDGSDAQRIARLRGQAEEAATAVTALRTSFFGTPYRPTGLATSTRSLVRLIDEVVLLESALERAPLDQRPGSGDAVVCEVKLAAADVLERGAALLESEQGDPVSWTRTWRGWRRPGRRSSGR